MIHFFGFVIAHVAVGSFAAGLTYGRDSHPPEPWAAGLVVFLWPLLALLAVFCAVFSAGAEVARISEAGVAKSFEAWITKKFGGGS